MTRCRVVFVALLLAVAFAGASRANAATLCGNAPNNQNCLHFIGVGSSALYQGTMAAVFNDIAPAFVPSGGSIVHWTMKSTSVAACSPLCAEVQDARFHPIQNDASNVWIVWVQTAAGAITDVWAYQQVDSSVGDRAFLSRAAAGGSAGTSLVAGDTQVGQNVVSSGLLGGTSDLAAGLPAGVVALVNNVPVTAAFTDIRAEDGLYATERLCSPLVANLTGLGYSTNKTCGATFAGTPIDSAYSATQATPIAFALPGFSDPVNGVAVPATIITQSIGESPIVFIVNRQNAAGLGDGIALGVTGDYQNLNDGGAKAGNPLGTLWSGGGECDGTNAAWTPGGGGNFSINLIQREALSGTMNTTEFSVFRTYANGSPNGQGISTSPVPTTSQEANIGAPTLNTPSNPLNKPCSSGGNRLRAVGTSELVNQVICGNAAACSGNAPAFTYTDALGYAFFSFGNVKSASLSKSYGYVTLDGVDPIFETFNNGGGGASGTSADPGQPAGGNGYGTNSGTYFPGTLPQCTTTGAANLPACKANVVWGPEGSFPNLRNGSYRAWSLLRALCDPAQKQTGPGGPGTVDECSSGAAADPGSLGNVIAKAQSDIDGNTGVPDFLPFTDVSFVRAHYNFQSTETAAPFNGPSSHTTPSLKFKDAAGVKNTPVDAIIGGGPDAGGDAGGCIEDATNGGVTIQSVTAPNAAHKVKYTYTQKAGANALATGDVVTITGFTNAGNNGTFTVGALIAGPPTQFKAKNAAGVAETPTPAAEGAVTQCSQ